MTGNLLKIATLVIVLLILKSCLFPATTSRALKITAEVETPQGLRSGSSVIELSSASIPKWLPGSTGYSFQLRGESPVVNLGDGKRLFVLLEDEHGGQDVMSLFRLTEREVDHGLDVDNYPVLVTFTDPDDAASVVKVSPENFAAIFGNGYSLRRILAEAVSEPPTFGALDEIPLFRNFILKLPIERRIASKELGGAVPASDPKRLTSMSFRQGAP
jgi:hypothetical protein